ncbi:voltage-gated potassium channel beta-2 subunit [Dendrothele bispora CBS 962.96]|uniref:Voltage-gated potassium channel beta-2 subunit n=1 Tax=Dendrothele bispora (strain CBS 962.96) TaxID=1314807 RepID=A0A4S8LJL1_DENBC|nr:voltage-gated potassium channel beta-2 subunit [Dendrothele bispora CBS 962.96]
MPYDFEASRFVKVDYDTKTMPFRRLGYSGLRVPLFALGGWLTMGGSVTGDPVKEIIKTAFDHGINFFDLAENYSKGKAEETMGRAIKELGFRRSDMIIASKVFFGVRSGPNAGGLSRKHIVEGTQECLSRLQMNYVDIMFAHRPDPDVPMEEIVRAFNYIIEKGWAFYWGTSEWSAEQIEEAFHIAHTLGLIAPIAEQCQHSMLQRERPEKEYANIFKKYGYGITTYSSLHFGVLTGKYNDGIPEGSRFSRDKSEKFNAVVQALGDQTGEEMINKVRALTKIANEELDAPISALALAWVAKNNNTSSIILGASKPDQLEENLKALEVLPKLTDDVMARIEEILDNHPAPEPSNGRPPLDETIY